MTNMLKHAIIRAATSYSIIIRLQWKDLNLSAENEGYYMHIRQTLTEDLDTVMRIYDQARQYMRENHNPNQWINGYPTTEMVQEDILTKSSYVCTEGEEIVGVFRFTLGEDPTYKHIYQGSWLNEEPYGVVHRIASASHKKGVATFCLEWCLVNCGNIRIDTHRDNHIMQRLLAKNDYRYCGIIYLEDGSERLAYQKCF